MILLFVKAYLQKIVRIIRGNVYHAHMHLSRYFSATWKAVTINSVDKKISSLYIVLLLRMRIMH